MADNDGGQASGGEAGAGAAGPGGAEGAGTSAAGRWLGSARPMGTSRTWPHTSG